MKAPGTGENTRENREQFGGNLFPPELRPGSGGAHRSGRSGLCGARGAQQGFGALSATGAVRVAVGLRRLTLTLSLWVGIRRPGCGTIVCFFLYKYGRFLALLPSKIH